MAMNNNPAPLDLPGAKDISDPPPEAQMIPIPARTSEPSAKEQLSALSRRRGTGELTNEQSFERLDSINSALANPLALFLIMGD